MYGAIAQADLDACLYSNQMRASSGGQETLASLKLLLGMLPKPCSHVLVLCWPCLSHPERYCSMAPAAVETRPEALPPTTIPLKHKEIGRSPGR